MVETLYFIAGFAFCALVAWYFLSAAERRYAALQSDFRHLVNEFSLRTGGRLVFKHEKKVSPSDQNGDILGDDRYGIFTPSMAEEMAEIEDERDDTLDQITEADLEHLRKTKVIS